MGSPSTFNSDEAAAGIQYCRIISPMTVPGPTRVKSWPSVAFDVTLDMPISLFVIFYGCCFIAAVAARRFPAAPRRSHYYLHYANSSGERQPADLQHGKPQYSFARLRNPAFR